MEDQFVRPKKKYIALVRCQARLDSGKIDFFESGDAAYFENEAPKTFVEANAVSKSNINFNVVSRSLLIQEDVVPLEDMVAYVKRVSGVDLSGHERSEVVRYLISVRDNPTGTLDDSNNASIPTAQDFKMRDSGNLSGIEVDFSEDTDPDISNVQSSVEEDEDELDKLLSEG